MRLSKQFFSSSTLEE